MKKFGYLKTSYQDQSVEDLKVQLKKAGCSVIYKDIALSSKEKRPGFETLINSLNSEDVIVVQSLDNLACSINQLVDSVSNIQEKGAKIQSLEDNLNSSNEITMSQLFEILKSSKEKMLKAQTKPGREGAKARGRMGGRPEKVSEKQKQEIKRLYNEDIPVKAICERIGISRPTLYKYLKI
jgi:DNA invertase Pin-like site-specific DNA recombinase